MNISASLAKTTYFDFRVVTKLGFDEDLIGSNTCLC